MAAKCETNVTNGRNRNYRLSVSIAIIGYAGLLGAGVVMHTFDTPRKLAFSSYLYVWDMFCGWNSYERRLHFVAEGVSGEYYDAGEVPGYGITPHGPSDRREFDFQNRFTGVLAANVLERTAHEPIRRVYVVEEHWQKGYNLPSGLRSDVLDRTNADGSPKHFFHTQATLDPDGSAIQVRPLWHVAENRKAVFDNPRIRAAADRNRTLFATK